MMKNLKTKVSKYYKKLDKKLNFTTPNEAIFRLLGNHKFNYKNKNCLDIEIGSGDNLLEFKKRGANIFGIDIRKNVTNQFVKKFKLNKNNFYICDLNYDFPNIKKKMNLITMKDTLYYIELDKQFDVFKSVYNQLQNNGLFLFQYIQRELKLKNNNFFQFDLNKNYSQLRKYHARNNPISFLADGHIMKLIKSQKFFILKSIFDINTHCKKNQIITINRYFLLKRKRYN